MGNKSSKKAHSKPSKQEITSNLSNGGTNNSHNATQSNSNDDKSTSKAIKEENIETNKSKEIVQADSIEELFNRFSKGKEVMEPDDVIDFFEELKLDPQDVSAIVLSYHFKAATQCFFSKSEFLTGFKSLNCKTISDLQAKIPSFKTELEGSSFKDIYEFTFLWSRESPDKKNLDIDIASDMLELLLKNRYYFADQFILFLKDQTSYKCITKDQWSNLLEFCKIINKDLSNYDECASWPVMIDDFVEWYKQRDENATN